MLRESPRMKVRTSLAAANCCRPNSVCRICSLHGTLYQNNLDVVVLGFESFFTSWVYWNWELAGHS
jgi:hypothetical protein